MVLTVEIEDEIAEQHFPNPVVLYLLDVIVFRVRISVEKNAHILW